MQARFLASVLLVFGCRDRYQPKSLAQLTGRFKIINVHEHIQSRKDAPKLLRVMDDLSIARTVLCAASKKTTTNIHFGFVGYDDNNEEVLQIARMWPDRFIPFVTLNPRDPDNVARLEHWVQKGAKGLKLYTGHSLFYDLPLDDPGMVAVYRWAAAHKLPLIWHVNTGNEKYYLEFLSALDKAPGLVLIAPHHCMSSFRPARLRELLARYPTLYTDVSHGTPAFMADALRNIAKHPDQFTKIYREFPDRFMWGSDTVVTPHPRKTAQWIETMCGMYFGLYGDKSFVLHKYDKDYNETGTETLPGLDLPEDLLRRILQTNAERFFHLKPL
jgi:uncharacterized protein